MEKLNFTLRRDEEQNHGMSVSQELHWKLTCHPRAPEARTTILNFSVESFQKLITTVHFNYNNCNIV
jgi:hypothetical protein